MKVIFEDNHLIAINKNASDIVQGDKTGDVPLSEHVKRYLKEKYNKPGEVYCGVIHRLDRPVSGIVLFAKTDKALSRMNEMFRTREIKKTYWAIVGTKPEKDSGTLIHYLKKNEKTNKSHATKFEVAGSLKSETEYKLIASSDRYFLLEVVPHTGRHHQIRVQLAAMGCIIKGDLKYGAPRSNKDASISLHARKLEFIHPVKKEPVTIIAEVPEDPLWKAFQGMVEK
ncbi:MAG TPA: RluA family pseudouridine synthase [Bacteroidia bacterium]|nr:RluA family pseudouridine synthase [Bacteroidia bacterium]